MPENTRRVVMAKSDFREPPWMCVMCGYVMDAAGGLTDIAPPSEGDYSVCMNCGHQYTRHGTRWVPTTVDEKAAMAPENRRDIERIQQARRAVIREDLTRNRGGRA